jgi:hypothetical protein
VIDILTNGVASIASTGSARQDLRNAFEALDLDESSKPFIFAAPKLLKEMALSGADEGPPAFPDLLIAGSGTVQGTPAMPVDSLHSYSSHGDCLLVVDARRLAGSPGGIDVTASQSADIQMTDSASGAADMVSMFQTNSIALRATRWFNVERAMPNCVAWVTDANYHYGSS